MHAKTNEIERGKIPLEKQTELLEFIAGLAGKKTGNKLEEILENTCRELCKIIDCSRAMIFIPKKESGKEIMLAIAEASPKKNAIIEGLKLSILEEPYLQNLISKPGTIAVTNLAEFPDFGEKTKNIVESLDMRSMLAIATRYRDVVNGVIWVQECDRPREWTWEGQVMEILADRIAIAIQEAGIYNDSNLYHQGESLLRLVVSQIRESFDLDTILTSAVRGARQLLESDRAVIYEFKENWQGKVIVEDVLSPWESVLDSGTDKCFSEGYARLYKAGRIRAINDIYNADLDLCHIQLLERLQVQANLVVPIIIGQANSEETRHLWGLLIVHQCREARYWQPDEIELLRQLAEVAAIAINQASLYDCTRRQAERESLLRLIINQIRRTLDLDTILNTAVSEVRQLLNTDRVVIYKFINDWQGEVIVEDLIVPWPPEFQDNITDNCFSGEYGKLYLQGRVRGINDILNSGLDPCHANYLAKLQVKANLIVPIVFRKTDRAIAEADSPNSLPAHLWGLLIAHECKSTRIWEPEELALLEKLGEQLAVAIYQAELYQQVKDSAAKSEKQAQSLQEAMAELQATQLQLIQSEKMSSLGKMVGGIAHEINNPNNFINANLFHVRQYAESLLEAIDRCAEASPEVAALIEQIDEELELGYIRSDFPELIQSMRQGSDRISAIVKTMRKFSRLDEAKFKLADLNESIESSLAMLEHRLKTEIKINKEYGDLPKVECMASAINQVFFNLLHNALDAVEEKDTDAEVTIRTEKLSSDKVKISIRDNGIGIPPEIQNQIFDPFFTTKEPGQGTGLGLSICYQVVVKGHQGQIRCISELGKGTEFMIELPCY